MDDRETLTFPLEMSDTVNTRRSSNAPLTLPANGIHSPRPSFRRKLVTLFFLYTVQGLPYGFFITILPLFMREAGWSRTAIGFLGIIGLPWFLKPLWAPLVDRFSIPGVGRRKSWIMP